MKSIITSFLFFSLLACHDVNGQNIAINKVKFFEDTSMINAAITTNMVKLFRQKDKIGVKFPANFSATFQDGSKMDDSILLVIRGHYRRANCYLPPLKVIFNEKKKKNGEKDKKKVKNTSLGSLKLVSQCKTAEADEQYLLKEYLIYKIYNLITDMGFRVRLINLNLVDNTGKKKTIKEYSFLMEDIKDLAKRNKCKSWKQGKMDPRDVDRRQMTIVSIFEYMIGNTDWGVSVNHNTKLILSKRDSTQRPYVVPYDFDFSGFVNTDYSTPDPMLNIASVRERVYRGFPRTIEELNEVLDIFKKQKDSIYNLINNFSLLTPKSKKDIISYLDDFYETINNPNKVNKVFIKNARTD
ncbi:MAG TPA: hypothetical protein VMU83_16510 [Hanamia sp.]|nr:hypothetical protein [Hanamia sp.]